MKANRIRTWGATVTQALRRAPTPAPDALSEKILKAMRRIRWATGATLAFGVIASGAANVLHAEPNVISRVISAWPPFALLLTVELISRVPVHKLWMAIIRLLATGVIAGVAGWISYWHMASVTAKYGETGSSAYLLPLTVDGLVVVASISLVELNARIRDLETRLATPITQPAQDRPQENAVVKSTQDEPPVTTEVAVRAPVKPTVPTVPASATPQPLTASAAPLPGQLLAAARKAADDYLAENGRVIPRDELQKVLRVSNATTGDIMRALDLHATPRQLAAAAVSPLTGNPLL